MLLTSIVPVKVNRGDVDDADDDVRLVAELMSPDDQQERAQHSFAEATVLLAKGDAVGALAAAEAALATREANGIGLDAVKEAFVVAVDAALRVGDVSKAENLLAIVEGLPAGRLPQFLRAHASRFTARLGSPRAEDLFKGAAALFRELGVPFYLAVTELELSEWLVAQGQREQSEPLLAEAREIFERLEAKPWLERLEAAVRAGARNEVSA